MRAANTIIIGVILAAALAALILAVFTPLDLTAQVTFGAALVLAAALIGRRASRTVTLALCILSVVVSTRYMVWRTTQTLDFPTFASGFLGMGLYLAEVYVWVILLLGYVQTAWPLRRPVRPLDGAPETWPTIDVLIPTYNESLQIVRDTVLAALAMDYPPDRFKVYLLDDGRRPEFKAFAETAGAIYITRPDNLHAKAGNLNNALKHCSGELVCVFDADHIPTRAFLQMTAGWFQEDARLALLQTPHHFYSPDPVQRNLVTVRDVPDEGALFYGVVQPGNDLWNAAFFCGSCALIRRGALDQTDGFAGETVTEDAHTALKLQRRGWNTAYLDVRLASGLATERLALHIGQRARWARGMMQIFRIDNPLLGRGLKLPQRLCYLNAMLHFMFPLPRLVFLTSPLAFLLFGQGVIQASPAMIAAYATPHLIMAIGVANRLQGKDRRAFWGEVYETLLTFHLIRPTLQTLIDPRRGKFNVTDKGGVLERGYFDWRLMWPHLAVAALLVIGILAGFARLLWPDFYEISLGTLMLNAGWSAFSLLILLVALAVGRETRQLRHFVRVGAHLPIRLHLVSGETIEAATEEISMGGLSAPGVGRAVRQAGLARFEMFCSGRWVVFPAEVIDAPGEALRLRFGDIPLTQRRELVAAVMGRADAWQPASKPPPVNPLRALASLLAATLSLFTRRTGRQRAPAPQNTPSGPIPAAAPLAGLVLPGLVLSGLVLTGMAVAPPARAQVSAVQSPAAQSPGAATAASIDIAAAPKTRRLRQTLRQMGVDQPLRLVSVDSQAGVPFRLGVDEVATSATLTLTFSHSPALLADLSHLTVTMNGEVIDTLPLGADSAHETQVVLPIDPALVLVDNRLGLRFIGHYSREAEDPAHSALWAQVSNTRTVLDLELARLPAVPDLARLPAPFFDGADRGMALPFVFAGQPERAVLQGAGAAASYFGAQAGYRGFRFPVSIGQLPAGDAVVFIQGRDPFGLLPAPPAGPTLMIVPNPREPDAQLLLVAGRDAGEVRQAAITLSLGAPGLSGDRAQVGPPDLPERRAYDAPRWLPTDRKTRLGEIVDPAQLAADGLPPGPVRVPFRLAPDLLFWPRTTAPLDLRYRYPMGDWIDREASRLDVSLNEQYLRSFRLNRQSEADTLRSRLLHRFVLNQQTVGLPPYNLFGQNELEFYFDLKPRKAGAEESLPPTNVRSGIDPDSTIDLTGAHHFTRLPNLAYFASSGFPFTRMADLSETAVLLPANPSPMALEAYLHLMGRFGDATGAPAARLILAAPGETDLLRNRDILLIGGLDLLSADKALAQAAPVEPTGRSLRLRAAGFARRAFSMWGTFVGRPDDGRERAASLLVAAEGFSGYLSFPSPYGRERAVVALVAADPKRLPPLAAALDDPAQNARMRGDLVVGAAEGLTAFQVGRTFATGDMPLPLRLLWRLSQTPLLMALLAAAAAVALAVPLAFLLRRQERRRLAGLSTP